MNKMTKILISLTFCTGLIFTACTAPTQPIAYQSFKWAVDRNDTIVTDLANMAKYQTLEKYGAEAERAAAASQPSVAKAAVKDAINAVEKISWLQLQAERNRRLFMLTQIYIQSQQGILNIWADDLKEAKAQVDAEAGKVK